MDNLIFHIKFTIIPLLTGMLLARTARKYRWSPGVEIIAILFMMVFISCLVNIGDILEWISGLP